MAKAKVKSIVRSAAVDKTITGAIDTLTVACANCARAVKSRARDAKKFTAESKRLAKKKAILARRKKITSAKLKKGPNAQVRKLLKTTVNELAVITKAGAKNRVLKSANAVELAGLKDGLKKAKAYMKVIVKAEKELNKPKKKRKSRR